ncbi:hypothetical protein FQN50_006341 [Emmonsiellopsis sp. PD_5]|nr:hypothetical protein FQN50_006341 [Emmonsiellopsis sp. PD_5]
MHSLIAISETHLHHLVPTYDCGQFKASYHWELAMASFQRELVLPPAQHNMDAMVSTCMMLAVLAFTGSNSQSSDSWIFSPVQSGTNWLYVQGGLSTILSQYKERAAQNIWIPAIHDADDHEGTFSDESPGPEGIPAAFVDLCDIDENSDSDNNPYHRPLRVISNLQRIEASSSTFTKLISFVGEIDNGYRDLLQNKDPRALLILAYWFGMMCAVDQWWVQKRVRSECSAICMFLTNNPDQRIQQLLEGPARACGYRK